MEDVGWAAGRQALTDPPSERCAISSPLFQREKVPMPFSNSRPAFIGARLLCGPAAQSPVGGFLPFLSLTAGGGRQPAVLRSRCGGSGSPRPQRRRCGRDCPRAAGREAGHRHRLPCSPRCPPRRAAPPRTDQDALRRQLAREGLAAFVCDGAVLPRASGASDLPMPAGMRRPADHRPEP